MTVAQDAAHELLQLRELARVDPGDRRLEQFLGRVAEHRAAGRVGGDEPVLERVEDERRIARVLEELIEGERGRIQACLTPST